MRGSRLKISVVITSYNYERYIGLAIESVLGQTRPVDEIIVIDDGSTDNSRTVISSYADKIRAIFKDNEGNKVATNRGFQETAGDVILFLDADDLLYARAIEMVENHWLSGAAKIQFDLDVIDEAGRQLNRRFCNFNSDITPQQTNRQFERTGTYVWPVTSGNAYARSFLERILPMMPPVSHDGVLNTIAPIYGAIITIPQALGQYRLHGRNLSRTDSEGRHKRFPDFARQIAFRRGEFDLLRQHAAALGVALPKGNFLDGELVFVNYRLMTMKLGQKYVGMEDDSLAALWYSGMTLALCQQMTLRSKLANIIWLSAILVSPRFLVANLILLRFNRAGIFSSFRNSVSKIFGRVGAGSAG